MPAMYPRYLRKADASLLLRIKETLKSDAWGIVARFLDGGRLIRFRSARRDGTFSTIYE
jgi:hypothetical protein